MQDQRWWNPRGRLFRRTRPRGTRKRERGAALERLEQRTVLATAFISEFMASNRSTLLDEDGQYSDWIEIHNPTDSPLSLEGWFLTDNPEQLTKWPLPSVKVAPQGFQLIFASGKNRRDPSLPLHANFQLSSEGEYLALVDPTLRVVQDWSPAYPPQRSDVSYGAAANWVETPLIASDDLLRAIVPADGSLENRWLDAAFDDSQWPQGRTGAGYDLDGTDADLLGVDLTSSMLNRNASAYVRVPFNVPQEALSSAERLQLSLKYDDGFAAYLNGQPLVSRNAPGGGQSPAQGLVAYYPFDEQLADEASQYTENVGSANNQLSTATADSARFVVGQNRSALALNAAPNDVARVTTSAQADLDLGGQFTIEAWIYPTQLTAWNRLVLQWDGSGKNSLFFAIRNGSQLSAFHVDAAGVQKSIDSPVGTVGLGSDRGWQHVALVGDGAQLRLYYNGREVSAGTRGTDPVPTPVAYAGTTKSLQAALGIGDSAAQPRSSDAYRGYLDELALWRVPLSNDQIASHYAAESAGYGLHASDRPSSLTWNASALRDRPEDDDGTESERFDLSESLKILRTGANLLAFHGLNVSKDDRDFLIAPELNIARRNIEPATIGFLEQATPSGMNTPILQPLANEVAFAPERGYYERPFQLQLTAPAEIGVLRYTLDGSEPTETNGLTYSAPIPISTTSTVRARLIQPGFRPGPITTHSYLFLDDILKQKNQAPVGAHWDTEMDPEVVNNTAQTHQVRDGLVSIPTLSIVMDDEDLFGSNGIYRNSERRGEEWVRPGSVEYFYPDEYKGYRVDEGFATTAGVRVAGIFSRLTSNPKHSLRLSFRSDFGPSKLEFPLFEDSPVTRFDNLVVLNGHNQSWATGITSALYLRDQVARDLQALEPQSVHTHGSYVHLYLNGLYWGQYNLTERPDDSFAAENFGGDKDDYDVLKGVRFGETPQAQLVTGTRDAWNQLFAVASRDLADPANYAQIQQLVDLDQLIDYNIGILYTGDRDGPTGIVAGQTTPKNFYAIRERSPEGRFRFFPWDAEFTFEELNTDVSERRGSENPALLHARLRVNEEYRLRFADRVQKWFFHDGPLTPQRVAEQFRERATEIDQSIVAESARWGDSKRGRPFTRDVEWTRELSRVLDRLLPSRSNVVLNQFRADRLFPELAAPEFQVQGLAQHGGIVTRESLISLVAATGDAYYTLDGSDPRQSDGKTATISPTAIRFTQPLSLDQSTRVKARVLSAGTWSPLSDVIFTVPLEGLQITEIMYHPQAHAAWPQWDENQFEFIEIANLGSLAIDLSSFTFGDGIDFTFPKAPTSLLDPHQYLVLAKNVEAFRALHGEGPTIAGTYNGQLANEGERVTLVDPLGQTLLDVSYDDQWYPETDGRGFSLTRNLANLAEADLSRKEAWKASTRSGGSPGRQDPLLGDLNDDRRTDALDIDLLATQIGSGNYALDFDLSRDGRLDLADHEFMILRILQTSYGDANLDGRFDSRDLVQIFQFGVYEVNPPSNARWESGDWNADGEFNSRDLVAAFQAGKYIE